MHFVSRLFLFTWAAWVGLLSLFSLFTVANSRSHPLDFITTSLIQSRDEPTADPPYFKTLTCTRPRAKLLNTGCGFSGTGFMSQVFQLAGLQIGHETDGADGVSCWACADYEHCQTEFEVVVATYNSPLTVLHSCGNQRINFAPLTFPSPRATAYERVARHAIYKLYPFLRTYEGNVSYPLDCLFWWSTYTTLARKRASVLFRFNTSLPALLGLFEELGLACDAACEKGLTALSGTRVNTHTGLNNSVSTEYTDWYALMKLAEGTQNPEIVLAVEEIRRLAIELKVD